VYLHILAIYQHTNYLLIYYQPPTYLPTYWLPTYLSLTLHKLPIMTYLTSNQPMHYQSPTYLPCYLLINTPNLLTYIIIPTYLQSTNLLCLTYLTINSTYQILITRPIIYLGLSITYVFIANLSITNPKPIYHLPTLTTLTTYVYLLIY